MFNYLPYLKYLLYKQAQDYGDPLTELAEGDIANFVLQHHKDDKRRDAHYDLRLGTPKNKGLFSFAVPKAELPEQGTRKAVFQTPIHPHSYDKIQGRIGTSNVRIHNKGKTLIDKVTPNTISFTLGSNQTPVRYSLVRLPPRGHKKTWLLVNNKPKEGGLGGRIIESVDQTGAINKAKELQDKIESKPIKVADIIKKAQSFFNPKIEIPSKNELYGGNTDVTNVVPYVVNTQFNPITRIPANLGAELAGKYFKGLQPKHKAQLNNLSKNMVNQWGGTGRKFRLTTLVDSARDNTTALPRESFKILDGYNPLKPSGRMQPIIDRALGAYNKTLEKKSSSKEKPMEKRIDCQVVPVAIVSSDGKERRKITVEVADNEDTRRKGLSKRADLPKDHGMLFTKSGAFWMKDCLIPLDIAFIAKDGTIVDKQAMDLSDEPDYLKPTYISRDSSAVYALEMPKGWFDANNISVKDRIVCRN